jgi:hypothetical protein
MANEVPFHQLYAAHDTTHAMAAQHAALIDAMGGAERERGRREGGGSYCLRLVCESKRPRFRREHIGENRIMTAKRRCEEALS